MVTTTIGSAAAPAVKLPLLTRKNIRDEYDAKLPELETKIKDILGEEYKAYIDFPNLFQSCTEGRERERIGEIAFETFQSFVQQLGNITDNGENKVAVDGINGALTKRKFTIEMDEDCPSWSGCKIIDGLLVITFKPGDYGTNNSGATEDLKKVIDATTAKTEPTKLPLIAKIGIKKDWEENQEEVEKKIADELNDEKMTCHADYPTIWKTIVDVHSSLNRNNKDDIKLEDCSRNFGYFIKEYFAALGSYMEWQFKHDDMVIEAFFDAVETKEVWFEMVGEKNIVESYCDCIIKDGKLVVRTTPQNFGVNIANGFEKLMSLL